MANQINRGNQLMGVLKIACVGDTMCGDSFDLLGLGAASSLDRYGSDFLPTEIANIFSSHDIVICNAECVLSDIGRKENSLRTLHMRGRPQTAAYLAKWGITVAHVANNHILEQGLEAAVDTVRQLEKAGVRTVGKGKDSRFQSGIEPLHLRFGDQTIAIIGACFHNGKYAFSSNLEEVLKTIKAEADKGNPVMVSVHWGDELIDRPSIQQRQMARKFVGAGASLVIGHHPHVVQSIDSSDNTLTAYSLGNFIFDGNSKATIWSIILSITMSGKKVLGWEAIPIVSDRNYRPVLAEGVRKDKLKKEISRRCNLVKQEIADTKKYQKEYASELKSLEAKSRHRLWLDIAKRFTRYRPIYWPQILWRPVQRRLGIW
jgi:poly-gamma-glutamate synthesis protein (capsule biosynthesis protein)